MGDLDLKPVTLGSMVSGQLHTPRTIYTSRPRELPRMDEVTATAVLAMAARRAGACHTTTIPHPFSIVRLSCSRGHEFTLEAYELVHQYRWCPRCKRGNSREEVARRAFEDMLDPRPLGEKPTYPFPRTRPKWLVDPAWKGRRELDGYCPNLSLAFEENGREHQHLVPFFTGLQTKREDDLRKEELCEENGVTLIPIPHWIRDIPSYVYWRLEELGYPVTAPPTLGPDEPGYS